ncbi:hypothetical protein [Paraburkholderia solisilvae]|uniref:hypothetical protein n=1 Tax=Paraburkholderia solisilvae TaxID=624376 RepID=UPI001FEC494F|nr:hypothetical protein [Paraburkholderia solisilvae]
MHKLIGFTDVRTASNFRGPWIGAKRYIDVPLKIELRHADNPAMSNSNDIPFGPDHPRYAEALALENSVRAVRKARGKKNSEDCTPGSPEWFAVEEDFLRDLARALGGDPDEIDD